MKTQQRQLLMDILSANRDTDYGIRYGFGYINTVAAYKNSVPVTLYEDYRLLIDLSTRIGESNIITGNPVACYVEGIGDSTRLFPITEAQQRSYASLNVVNPFSGSTLLFEPHAKTDKRFQDGKYLSTLGRCFLSSRKKTTNFNSHRRWKKGRSISAPRELFHDQWDQRDLVHLHALFALADVDIEFIYAPTYDDLEEILCFINENWLSLVEEIRSGTVVSHMHDERARELVERRLRHNASRAEAVSRAFKSGTHEIMQWIWPNFKGVSAYCNLYNEKLANQIQDKYNTISFDPPELLLTECFAAIGMGNGFYRFGEGCCYYEFLPSEATDSPSQTFELYELEKGQHYRTIITNHSGLYRYDTGYEIIAGNKTKEEVLFRFVSNE
ncbi:GH3 auxin-responsive promoter family protein [Ruminococcaceae bacterium OttesenSCG-928-A11]|nr:GH3 auxin-responsive promoter family protein [Ruminococcaceae bacterium OttesenSCG-928-A11]